MKIALSVWKDSISTVFDAADQLLLVEKKEGAAPRRSTVRFTSDGPARALQLRGLGVSVLICGAISRPQEAAISAAGIDVYPFVRGEVEAVMEAYENGQLQSADFALPGCRRRGLGAGRGRGRSRGGSGCPWWQN